MARIKALLSYNIPFFGNERTRPYFTAIVTDGTRTQVCKSKGDRSGDAETCQFLTFNRKRYKVINRGTMYAPDLHLELWETNKNK